MPFLTGALCVMRGLLAGIGLAVVLTFVLINSPCRDKTGAGAWLAILIFAAPLFALGGMAIEALLLIYRRRIPRE